MQKFLTLLLFLFSIINTELKSQPKPVFEKFLNWKSNSSSGIVSTTIIFDKETGRSCVLIKNNENSKVLLFNEKQTLVKDFDSKPLLGTVLGGAFKCDSIAFYAKDGKDLSILGISITENKKQTAL